jgi:hypothetical protein
LLRLKVNVFFNVLFFSACRSWFLTPKWKALPRPNLPAAFGHAAQAEQLAGFDPGNSENGGDLLDIEPLRGQFAEDFVFFRRLLVDFRHVLKPGTLQAGCQARGFEGGAEGFPRCLKSIVTQSGVDFLLQGDDSLDLHGFDRSLPFVKNKN